MLRRDSPTPREHMSERLWMRDRMALLHSVCHHHEFVKTSHRGSHETCSPQVLTEPSCRQGKAASIRFAGGSRSIDVAYDLFHDLCQLRSRSRSGKRQSCTSRGREV